MTERSRASRFAECRPPDYFRDLGEESSAWHETKEEIEAGLAWGMRKDELLRWLKRHMARRLTPRERRLIRMYYFDGMTYHAIAQDEKTSTALVARSIRRSIRKLRRTIDHGSTRETRRHL